MPKENRRKASSCQTTTVTEVSAYQPLFQDLFEGATYETVDAFACVPFTKTRQVSEAGVAKLEQLYVFQGANNHKTESPGFGYGTDTPIVVPLLGSLEMFVYKHFESEGLQGSELRETVTSRPIWYGIVDGLHSNHAFRRMITNKKE